MRYLRQRAVIDIEWDSLEHALHGVVRDQAGEVHTTTAYLSVSDAPQLAFDHGQCSCQLKVNCSHATALALAAAAIDRPRAEPTPAAVALAAAPLPAVPPAPAAVTITAAAGTAGWAKPLDRLLDMQPRVAASRSVTPLAIEVALITDVTSAKSRGMTTGRALASLHARLVQAGKNGGWIAGGLAWGKLRELQYGNFAAAQVRLLHEILAAYRSSPHQLYLASYGHGHERTIDLCAFESRQLWPLLDEADSVGLKLVYPRRLGTIDRYCDAEFCLDIALDAAGALS
jgi:hypothetical protein